MAKKGNVPWNKGKKGLQGPNRTSFKKGDIPKHKSGKWKSCFICGIKKFYKPSHIRKGSKLYFCSLKHMGEWRKGKISKNRTGKYIKCSLSGCNKKKYFPINLIKLPTKKYCSKEHMAKSMVGNIPWNKGISFLPGDKNSHWRGGKPNCIDCGKKLSTYTAIRCPNCNTKSEEFKKKVVKGRIAQQLHNGPTSIEKIIYDYLQSININFIPQYKIEFYLVDAYIPSKNLIIECDGEYWHSLPETIWRDKSKNTYLKNRGYNLIRLSEKLILNGNFKQLLANVLQ